MTPRHLEVAVERFALERPFVISRGARTEAVVVTVTISQGAVRGRGECVPYPRYGETVESVVAQIEGIRPRLEAGLDRDGLATALPAGAARNAVDCALWDFDAKRLGVPASSLAGLHRLSPATTAFTLSIGTPDGMAAAARAAACRPVLKVKLGGGEEDCARIAAVRAAAPDSVLIVDANEAWTTADLDRNLAACAEAGVALVEQPLAAGQDAALRGARPVPICADESAHTRDGLAALRERYDAINVKLDKTGGLTEALATVEAALALDFAIMVGCMVGSSLAMAPAMLLTPQARFVDLDGPLLLARDREPGLVYDGSTVMPPRPELWG